VGETEKVFSLAGHEKVRAPFVPTSATTVSFGFCSRPARGRGVGHALADARDERLHARDVIAGIAEDIEEGRR